MGLRQQLVKVRPGDLLKQGHTAVGEAWLLGRSRFSSIKGRAREIEDSSVELAQEPQVGREETEGEDRTRRNKGRWDLWPQRRKHTPASSCPAERVLNFLKVNRCLLPDSFSLAGNWFGTENIGISRE